jgi:hypothetical protein
MSGEDTESEPGMYARLASLMGEMGEMDWSILGAF